MTDTTPPAAIPWYNSTVLRGVVTIIVTQVVNYAQARFHIDTQVLGLGVNDIVAWTMDLISAGALAYMTHGRVTQKAAPAITVTKSRADLVNAENSGASNETPSTPPASNAPPTV